MLPYVTEWQLQGRGGSACQWLGNLWDVTSHLGFHAPAIVGAPSSPFQQPLTDTEEPELWMMWPDRSRLKIYRSCLHRLGSLDSRREIETFLKIVLGRNSTLILKYLLNNLFLNHLQVQNKFLAVKSSVFPLLQAKWDNTYFIFVHPIYAVLADLIISCKLNLKTVFPNKGLKI